MVPGMTRLLIALLCFVACAPVRPPASNDVTLVLRLPEGAPENGVITTIRFTEDEVDAGVHRQPAQLFTWLERLERVKDLDDTANTITLSLPAAREPTSLQVFVDGAGHGLDALFTPPGVAHGLVRVPANGPGSGVLTFKRPTPREACAGPRLQQVVLDAPELVRAEDDGRHTLCVFLPSSYERSPTKRYPVVFVFPGFSGHAAQNDGFSARGLFDSLGAAAGVEVILVGVETRIAEGTSYLARSERFGDWEGYVLNRVLPEVDRRFRTLPTRAAYGHSTGGWNALSLAVRRPGLFAAVGASSPDPLDLEAWLLQGGVSKPRWWHWQRAEQRLGGRGQFRSWALSWSPRRDGLDWLFDDAGVLRPAVYASWKEASPLARLADAEVPRLSGRLVLTAGRNDMFDLFTPTLRFVEAARARGVEVRWVPTELDHFGATEERFTPLIAFLLDQLVKEESVRR